MQSKAQAGRPPETTPVEIELSVKVSDGSFEGSLRVPVMGGAEMFKSMAGTWMQMLSQALNLVAHKQPEPETQTDDHHRS